jgi:hypothetical protein
VFNLRIEVNVNAQTDKQRAATAPTVTPRRKASNVRSTKAVRELRATVAQIDELFPALADKPAKQADLLIEKCATVKTLIALESEELETEQAGRVEELEQQLSVSAAKIAELPRENAALKVTASTREVVTVPDPNHAAVKEDRDALQSIVALLAATLAEDARAETAVRVSQSCNSPRAVESFCRLVNVNYGALTRYTTSSESDLRRLQTARDSNGVIVRAVLAVNYAAPVKPQAPAVFILDTRSADEKLRDAKASVRAGL